MFVAFPSTRTACPNINRLHPLDSPTTDTSFDPGCNRHLRDTGRAWTEFPHLLDGFEGACGADIITRQPLCPDLNWKDGSATKGVETHGVWACLHDEFESIELKPACRDVVSWIEKLVLYLSRDGGTKLAPVPPVSMPLSSPSLKGSGVSRKEAYHLTGAWALLGFAAFVIIMLILLICTLRAFAGRDRYVPARRREEFREEPQVRATPGLEHAEGEGEHARRRLSQYSPRGISQK